MISFLETKPYYEDIDYSNEIFQRYLNVELQELPHMIVTGRGGCGKTVQIYSFLASLLKTKDIYSIKTTIYEEDRKEIHYRHSPYHVEFSPLDLSLYEGIFVFGFLKEYVKNRNVAYNIPKIVYIKNAEYLSESSQKALNIMLERNIDSARFIFECNQTSSFLRSLYGRCFRIRIFYPERNQIEDSMRKMVRKYFEKEIKKEDIDRCFEIASHFEDHMKHIYGPLFAYYVTGRWIQLTSIVKIDELVEIVLEKEVKMQSIVRIRELVNELYIDLVSFDRVIRYLLKKIFERYKDQNEICWKVTRLWVKFDEMMKKGNKITMHMECFLIYIMEVLHFGKKEEFKEKRIENKKERTNRKKK